LGKDAPEGRREQPWGVSVITNNLWLATRVQIRHQLGGTLMEKERIASHYD
jgi:hypothetical protein